MQTGYDVALKMAAQELETMKPEAVCARCGALYRDGEYFIPWFGIPRALSAGNDSQRIIWMHYMLSEGAKKPSGGQSRLIAYRDMDEAIFNETKHENLAVRPLLSYFGQQPEALLETGKLCGSRPAGLGDASITVDVLPYMPLTFVIWAGDDEFPAQASVLFDETVKGWLCSEDVVVLGKLAVSELIQIHKNSKLT
ncbi:MAG: DUF3786 domain-containing protein [Clostridiales bacterium]|jgi:hypothetical protein|nr:DUF3786 domain-containing protein [Clostridiales bacterium]